MDPNGRLLGLYREELAVPCKGEMIGGRRLRRRRWWKMNTHWKFGLGRGSQSCHSAGVAALCWRRSEQGYLLAHWKKTGPEQMTSLQNGHDHELRARGSSCHTSSSRKWLWQRSGWPNPSSLLPCQCPFFSDAACTTFHDNPDSSEA